MCLAVWCFALINLVHGSQVPPAVDAPPAYYVQGWDSNAYQVAPASSTLKVKPVVRPFRIVTTASVAVVYALLAWRAATMRDRLLLNMGQPSAHSRAANCLVIANGASCFIASARAQAHKRMLKLVLAIDFTLEVYILSISILRSFSAQRDRTDLSLPAGLSAFWYALIIISVLRSNWISSLPDSRKSTQSDRQQQKQEQLHLPSYDGSSTYYQQQQQFSSTPQSGRPAF
mmetsp:Transcript_6291/g.8828  ORF Transcript_6291/g.8828 Transcript_6291/m.8828 type:complete len:230 (-) Transcript_6291:1126-1815(-)